MTKGHPKPKAQTPISRTVHERVESVFVACRQQVNTLDTACCTTTLTSKHGMGKVACLLGKVACLPLYKGSRIALGVSPHLGPIFHWELLLLTTKLPGSLGYANKSAALKWELVSLLSINSNIRNGSQYNAIQFSNTRNYCLYNGHWAESTTLKQFQLLNMITFMKGGFIVRLLYLYCICWTSCFNSISTVCLKHFKACRYLNI